jgi:hypothetical protein
MKKIKKVTRGREGGGGEEKKKKKVIFDNEVLKALILKPPRSASSKNFFFFFLNEFCGRRAASLREPDNPVPVVGWLGPSAPSVFCECALI